MLKRAIRLNMATLHYAMQQTIDWLGMVGTEKGRWRRPPAKKQLIPA